MCNLLKANTGSHRETNPDRIRLETAVLLFAIAALTTFPGTGLAGSARDYLNAPIDSLLTLYNVGYSTLVTPEDGMDVTSSIAPTSSRSRSSLPGRWIIGVEPEGSR